MVIWKTKGKKNVHLYPDPIVFYILDVRFSAALTTTKKKSPFFHPPPLFFLLAYVRFFHPKGIHRVWSWRSTIEKNKKKKTYTSKGGAHDYWPVGNGVNEIQFASCRLKLKTLNPLLSLFDQLTKRIMSSSTNLINFFFFDRFIRTVSRFY